MKREAEVVVLYDRTMAKPRTKADLAAAAVRYLRFVLTATSLSPRQLAIKAAIAPSTVTRALNDPEHKFALSMPTLQKIEEASGVQVGPFLSGERTVHSVMDFDVPIATPHPMVALPGEMNGTAIIGEVAAGFWRELDILDEMPRMPLQLRSASRLPPDSFFACIVRGTSINRIAQDGDMLFCLRQDDRSSNFAVGRLAIVQRKSVDGRLIETSAKRVQLNRHGLPEFWPDSDDPKHQSPLPMGPNDESSEVTILGWVEYVVRDVRRR